MPPRTSFLTLGWALQDGSQHPRYWFPSGTRIKPGGHDDRSDTVRVKAESIAQHTIVIAQSGSGKSFFVGRLIEEILLQSKSRVVVLDLNSDFVRCGKTKAASCWEEARYDPKSMLGFCVTESTRAEFAERWRLLKKRVSGYGVARGFHDPEADVSEISLPWSKISIDVLASEMGPKSRSELQHCHEFLGSVEVLARAMRARKNGPSDLIDEAESLFYRCKLGKADIVEHLRNRFYESFVEHVSRQAEERAKEFDNTVRFPKSWVRQSEMSEHIRKNAEIIFEETENALMRECSYVSEESARYYFGRARFFQGSGIIDTDLTRPNSATAFAPDMEIVDLASIPNKQGKMLAVNVVLRGEWERSRAEFSRRLSDLARSETKRDKRVPTFVVVDEAHNLIPMKAESSGERTLREQFRTIAAEGRKYGIFLILVSQRPDKLDSLTISECENKVVMKVGSKKVLETTKNLLGLDDVSAENLNICRQFRKGRGLLAGLWSPKQDGKLFYTAARRTIEGGGSLSSKYWAQSRV